MRKVGDKMLKDFTDKELKTFIDFQTKHLKKNLERETGAKIGKKQLERKLEKVSQDWMDLKVSEINFIQYIVEKPAQSTGEILVTLSAVEVAKEVIK